ncbi:MAG: hypothetical protein JXQ83_11655 [Candidatus Glassbacteria bacterium]|nr:hypothetical protein [Candidatus Glassbacteria bacterium]
MAGKTARKFILASLLFFIFSCVEGLVYPTKHLFTSFYAAAMFVPPDQLKPFLSDFYSKIHTHISLIGWVSSALMGIVYFIAPQIRGKENFSGWICHTNFWLHLAGIIVLCLGWTITGSAGLGAGFRHGTPEFTRAVILYKPVLWAGGGAILVSALLFSYNIVFRCLFLPVEQDGVGRETASLKNAGPVS